MARKAKPKLSLTDVHTADEQIAKLTIVKSLALNEALHSSDVDSIYKAQQYLKTIDRKDASVKPQSLLLDPQTLGADGYKNKSFALSYEMLRGMARTPIMKAIIETRKEQVCAFMEPQKDKYSTGFVIRPKNAKKTDSGYKLTTAQERRVEELTEFVLNCGDNANEWHGDNINSFTRKVLSDSLSMDQACFEMIRNRGGELTEFIAVDGATMRIADTHNDEKQSSSLKKGEKNGYLPYYVQVYQSRIIAEFYPWELCFGVRNPSSSILSNGYGRSELEDLIENVTAMLNTDQYNANYFKVGSNPKGILKVTGNVNQGRIEEFKNSWQATMAGVRNSHKLMVIEADKMDFINTQGSNKDMEYSKYNEFLIKVGCAHYKIDPSEVGFNMQGESGSGGGFKGNDQEAKVQYSKDKGLKPLVKQYNSWLQKNILNQKDSGYEIILDGLDAETPEQELDNDVKAVTNWSTVNEIRRKRGMKDLPGMDIILNPIALQKIMGDQQNQQQEESNQYMDQGQDESSQKDNPFTKSLEKDIQRLFERDSIVA